MQTKIYFMMHDVSNEYWLMLWMFIQFFYKLDQNVAQPTGFLVVKHAHLAGFLLFMDLL
jgi:hypothetical protein